MAEQEHDRCFQKLIQQIVFGQLVIFTGQHPLSRKAIPYRSGHINLPADNGNILFFINIFPIKPLFQLPSDTFCENRRKEIMYILKLYDSYIFISALIQNFKGIREHIIYVFMKMLLSLIIETHPAKCSSNAGIRSRHQTSIR